MFHWFKRLILAVLIIVAVISLYLLIPVRIEPAKQIVWGLTFTKSYAQYLGLNWKETYLAMLDELGVQKVRMGINWDEIESEQRRFEFADYDWMMNEAEKRGVEIVPAIGFKLPRWPECRAPQWTRAMPRTEFEQAQLAMMRAVVEHFKDRPNIKIWQVENEGFIGWFGECPPIPDSFVRREVEFVRALDSRPILMTESGELSTGLRSALISDIVGTSLYREVWSPIFGFIKYPLPPSFYAHKGKLLRPWVQRFIITELQLEAWAPSTGLLSVPIEEQLKIMSPEKMSGAIQYARRTGLDEIHAWGVEWWYWLKQKGHSELWEVAREHIKR